MENLKLNETLIVVVTHTFEYEYSISRLMNKIPIAKIKSNMIEHDTLRGF